MAFDDVQEYPNNKQPMPDRRDQDSAEMTAWEHETLWKMWQECHEKKKGDDETPQDH